MKRGRELDKLVAEMANRRERMDEFVRGFASDPEWRAERKMFEERVLREVAECRKFFRGITSGIKSRQMLASRNVSEPMTPHPKWRVEP